MVRLLSEAVGVAEHPLATGLPAGNYASRTQNTGGETTMAAGALLACLANRVVWQIVRWKV